MRSPRFSAKLSFDENGWTGGVLPTTGTVVFAPAQALLLAQLSGHYWKGAAITVQTGPDIGPFTTRLTGTVADTAVSAGKLVLTIADLSAGIDKPLLTARFAGTGGIEGTSEATGRLKRRSWGRVFNVEGRILDKANNIWEFGDPTRPLQGIDVIRDKGQAGIYGGTVAWQGSIAATLAALQAAAAPQGGCIAAPTIACVKWWTQPSGPLTADLRGEVGPGYVEDVIGIAGRVLGAIGGPAIGNAVTAAGWRPGPAGLHIADENETAAQALDRVLLGASLLWVLDPAGTIAIRQISFTGPVETLKPIRSSRLQQLKPTKSRRAGYQRNQRQHGDGEIAAVLRGSDVAYADGTLIDNLKPLESGANKTETRTAAAITGQGSLATQNSANWGTQVGGRPVELTDGRVANGLSSNGSLHGGLQSVGGPVIAMADLFASFGGTNIAPNPEVATGTGGYAVYNNVGGSKVAMARVASDGAPNSSGYVLRISYDGTGAPDVNPVPGFGGVNQSISPGAGGASRPGFYAKGTVLLLKVIANIPVGRYLAFTSNQLGDGFTITALTDFAGSGDWKTYVCMVKIGRTGTFGSGGHIYIIGGANTAFSWDVAKYDIIDITSAARVFMGNTLADENGVARFAVDLVTLLGTAGAITGQGALATQNAATWASQIIGAGKPADNATVGAIAGSNLLETVGGAVLALAAIKTVLGTAAGITGQGSLATQNAATWASQVTGSGKPADNATVGAIAGVNMLDALAGAILTLAMIKTALGTAAGIAGQGALATKNAVDWNTADIINKPTIGGDGRTYLGFTGLPSAVVERVVEAGASVSLEASVNFNSSINATRQALIEVAPSGGSYSTAAAGGTYATTPSEPFTDSFSASWTNTTGSKQLFSFRVNATLNGGLTVAQRAQNYLVVG